MMSVRGASVRSHTMTQGRGEGMEGPDSHPSAPHLMMRLVLSGFNMSEMTSL